MVLDHGLISVDRDLPVHVFQFDFVRDGGSVEDADGAVRIGDAGWAAGEIGNIGVASDAQALSDFRQCERCQFGRQGAIAAPGPVPEFQPWDPRRPIGYAAAEGSEDSFALSHD